MEFTSLNDLSRNQNNLITRTQVMTLGISRSTLRHKVATGRWTPVLPDVYAMFDGPIDDSHRHLAAWLYCGDESMLTGAAACVLAGLHFVPSDPTVPVLIPSQSHSRSTEFVRVVRSERLPRANWNPRARLRTVPPPRAVLDAARDIGLRIAREVPHRPNGEPILTVPATRMAYTIALADVRALMCDALLRGLAAVDDLARELDDGPRAGSALARRALTDARAGARSAPECEARDLIIGCDRLPDPLWNTPIPGLEHIVPDAQWREAHLILEIESDEWHRFGDGPERTEQRRALLAAAGWTVAPISPLRLRSAPAVVLAELVAAYKAGCTRIR